MLKQTRTPEGESFVSMQILDVEVPAVMGGSVTITHKIEESSPLFDCVVDGAVAPYRLEAYAFSATIVANDDIYQAEINAMKRYTYEDFCFNKRFADVMVVDGETKPGEAPSFKVDFDRFHDVRDLPLPSSLMSPSKASPMPAIDVKMCL
jgi:hypothetical protein